jgi:hypothetical protein
MPTSADPRNRGSPARSQSETGAVSEANQVLHSGGKSRGRHLARNSEAAIANRTEARTARRPACQYLSLAVLRRTRPAPARGTDGAIVAVIATADPSPIAKRAGSQN